MVGPHVSACTPITTTHLCCLRCAVQALRLDAGCRLGLSQCGVSLLQVAPPLVSSHVPGQLCCHPGLNGLPAKPQRHLLLLQAF